MISLINNLIVLCKWNKLCSEGRTIDNSKSHNYLFAAELCRCSLKLNQVISCRCNHRHNQIFLREKTSHVSVGVSKLVALNSYTKRQNNQLLATRQYVCCLWKLKKASLQPPVLHWWQFWYQLPWCLLLNDLNLNYWNCLPSTVYIPEA